MQLKSVVPSHGTFTFGGYTLNYLMCKLSLNVTDRQFGAVGKLELDALSAVLPDNLEKHQRVSRQVMYRTHKVLVRWQSANVYPIVMRFKITVVVFPRAVACEEFEQNE